VPTFLRGHEGSHVFKGAPYLCLKITVRNADTEDPSRGDRSFGPSRSVTLGNAKKLRFEGLGVGSLMASEFYVNGNASENPHLLCVGRGTPHATH